MRIANRLAEGNIVEKELRDGHQNQQAKNTSKYDNGARGAEKTSRVRKEDEKLVELVS